MKLTEKSLEQLFIKAIINLKPDFNAWDKLFIQKASNDKFGDYQTNFAMVSAKDFAQAPRQSAQQIIDNFPQNNLVEKLEIAGPGFINIYLQKSYLEELVTKLGEEDFDFSWLERAGQVVIDYSSPNIAKRMHIGHLRSTVIGDAIKRIYRYLGYQVVADNHIGDWGTQFGKLIVGYRNWLQRAAYETNPIDELERIYVKFSIEAEQDESLNDAARLELKKLHEGDAENLRLWREFIDVSLNEYNKIYQRLDISFDQYRGESFYHEMMPEIIELLKNKNLAESSQEALVVFFDEAENLHPCLVQKKDGAYLYATSDLACLKHKRDHYDLNKAIYVTDERQQTHFKQIFKIAEMLGWQIKTEHVWFGIMRFQDGIFSSRKGNVIRLQELLDEAVKRVRAVIEEKNPDLPTAEKELVAEKIGVGAIKYADLSKNPQSMVIFDWDKMLSFEGNTAPYLQYTHARIKSVFRKAAQQQIQLDTKKLHLADELDHALALKLSQFPDAVLKAAESCKPNIVADYLFDLGQKFNSYYNQKPFLKAEKQAQNSRLLLASKTAEILAQGLDLLGIEAVDRM
ncbi:MAG: arginine--tRNA ligase [Candidatus Cloacimonadales bacterium]